MDLQEAGGCPSGAPFPIAKAFRTDYDLPKSGRRLRRIIYTTNIIEGFNRQIRNVTKSKGVFTSEVAFMYL